MTDRVLDIAEYPAKVSLRGALLVVEVDGKDGGSHAATVPLEEISAVIASHPQVTFSLPALSAISSAGASLVVCDSRRMPTGMLVPLEGHFVQEESGEAHRRRLRIALPPDGQVRLLSVTDKQFGRQEIFVGKKSRRAENRPEQLLLF